MSRVIIAGIAYTHLFRIARKTKQQICFGFQRASLGAGHRSALFLWVSTTATWFALPWCSSRAAAFGSGGLCFCCFHFETCRHSASLGSTSGNTRPSKSASLSSSLATLLYHLDFHLPYLPNTRKKVTWKRKAAESTSSSLLKWVTHT